MYVMSGVFYSCHGMLPPHNHLIQTMGVNKVLGHFIRRDATRRDATRRDATRRKTKMRLIRGATYVSLRKRRLNEDILQEAEVASILHHDENKDV